MKTLMDVVFPRSDRAMLSLEYVKRVRYMVNVSAVVYFFFLIAATTKYIGEKTVIFTSIVVLTEQFYLSVLILIRKKKYEEAALVSLAIMLVCNCAQMYALPYEHPYDFYKVILFLVGGLVIACLITFRKQHIIWYSIISFILLWLNFAFRFFLTGVTRSAELYTVFLISNMILIAMCFAAYFITSLSKELVAVAEEEMKKNRNKFERLQSVITDSSTSFAIGRQLIESSDEGNTVSHIISENLKAITEMMDQLASYAKTTDDTNVAVVEQAKALMDNVMSQNSALTETTAAIREITAIIQSLAQVSATKRESVNRLATQVKEQEGKISEARNAMEQISKSSETVMLLTKLIVDIAEKTNLLAMNASIESAHAGEAGRGFAVVAREIRVLADEANINTKKIVEAMKKNSTLITFASQFMEGLFTLFGKITEDYHQLVFAMDEIISGIGEISTGTQDISSAAEHLTALSHGTERSSQEMQDRLIKGREEISKIAQSADNVCIAIEDIVESYRGIERILSEIDKAGKGSVDGLSRLNSNIIEINAK